MNEITLFECRGCGDFHTSLRDVRQCNGVTGFLLSKHFQRVEYRPVDGDELPPLASKTLQARAWEDE